MVDILTVEGFNAILFPLVLSLPNMLLVDWISLLFFYPNRVAKKCVNVEIGLNHLLVSPIKD
jgi:hypothetical protein